MTKKTPKKVYAYRYDPEKADPATGRHYSGAVITAAAYTEKQRDKAIERLKANPHIQWVRKA